MELACGYGRGELCEIRGELNLNINSFSLNHQQHSHCIARNLARHNVTNIKVYYDIWKSLNSRFQQRIYDPRVRICT